MLNCPFKKPVGYNNKKLDYIVMFNVPFYVIPKATGTHQMLEHQASELHRWCYCLQISYWLQMAISISCKLLRD